MEKYLNGPIRINVDDVRLGNLAKVHDRDARSSNFKNFHENSRVKAELTKWFLVNAVLLVQLSYVWYRRFSVYCREVSFPVRYVNFRRLFLVTRMNDSCGFDNVLSFLGEMNSEESRRLKTKFSA